MTRMEVRFQFRPDADLRERSNALAGECYYHLDAAEGKLNNKCRGDGGGQSVCPLDVVPYALAQCREVDLLHAAAAREIERMRGSGPHGDAGAHHPHAGECRAVTIDAAPGGNNIVSLARNQAG